MRPLSVLLCSLALAFAWQPDAVLRLSSEVVSSDCTPRVSNVFNGTSPGPTLRFKAGQSVWIRVYNDLPDANTTLHVHGISQYGSPFADGTPIASQWPIAPSQYFDYEFNLSSKDSAGTYFYHTHVNIGQVTAYGAFIIEDADPPPYQYDEEREILLADYYHANDSTIQGGLLNQTFKFLGEPQSLLVNGQAVGTCHASTVPANTTCSTSCALSRIEVEPDTTYRLRFIAAQILSYDSLGFEGHNFTLIEVDGDYVKPMNLSHLEIAAGQRYSVLLTDEVDADGSNGTYWMNLETRWRPVRTSGAALLVYNNASTAGFVRPPTLNQTVTMPNETYGWIIDQIEPLVDPMTPTQVDQTIHITSIQAPFNGTGSRWSVDGSPDFGETPPVPYLVQLYEGARPNYTIAEMTGGYDNSTGSNVWPVKKDRVLDIVVSNQASIGGQTAEAHPWHLHGRHFAYLGSGQGAFNASDFYAQQANRTTKPYLRDTQVVFPSPGPSYAEVKIGNGTAAGWSVFRVVTSDPGVWLLHCHIIPHALMGMNALLAFGAEDLPPLPQSYLSSYLTYGTEPQSEPRSYWAALAE